MLFFGPLAGREAWTQVTGLPLPPLLLIVLRGGWGVREEWGQAASHNAALCGVRQKSFLPWA